MPERTNIYIDISDHTLKEKTCQRLSEDWTINWTFVSKSSNKANPEQTHIAVIDNQKSLEHLQDSAAVIFLGATDDDAPYFSILEEVTPDSLTKAIKRAYSYREITNQNAESLYCPKNKSALESMAQSLSVRVHQLMKQSEMRIAMVDQLPIGVLGIDDENTIVLANPKAREFLEVEDLPVWGLKADALLGNTIEAFLKNTDTDEIILERNGHKLSVRKADFTLDENYAGIILTLWKIKL